MSTSVVTGGGRGIGRAIAQALAAQGSAVAITSRSANELAETVALIAGAGGRAQAYPADVLDAGAITTMLAAVERDLGPIDLLVNNAGDGGPIGPLEQGEPARWWRTMEVNVRGPMLCTHAVLPGMIARRSGRIVNVSSGAAMMSIPYFSSYVTSKAALNKMTECLAGELQPHGISIFTVSPGPVYTAMSESLLKDEAALKYMPWFKPMFDTKSVPPERVATLVATIATGKVDALTGRFLSFDDNLEALLAKKD